MTRERAIALAVVAWGQVEGRLDVLAHVTRRDIDRRAEHLVRGERRDFEPATAGTTT